MIQPVDFQRAAAPSRPFIPFTAVEGAVWPALPGGAATAVFAILDQLGQSQWWPADQLRRHQFRQLDAVVAHAARHVPFYAARLAAAGYRPGAALDEETWRRVPVLTRAEVQAAGRALDSPALPKKHGKVQLLATSGSTGTPIAVKRSQLSYLFWQAITLRDHIWHDRDIAAKLAMIRFDPEGHAKPPHGLDLQNWGEPTAHFYPTGPSAMLSISCSADNSWRRAARIATDMVSRWPRRNGTAGRRRGYPRPAGRALPAPRSGRHWAWRCSA